MKNLYFDSNIIFFIDINVLTVINNTTYEHSFKHLCFCFMLKYYNN